MRRYWIIAILTFSFLAAAIDISATRPPNDDTVDVWNRYVVAKKRFHFDVFELLSEKWRDLAPTLRLQRDQDLAGVVVLDLKFQYLVSNAPERITTDQGLSSMARFDWSNDDAKILREASADYVMYENFLARTGEELVNAPNLTETQRRFIGLQTDKDYIRLTDRFDRFTAQLDIELR
jgi:hypothetical protein